MLLVVSDVIEPWFKYIWEQFVEMNGLRSDFKLVTHAESGAELNTDRNEAVLEYGSQEFSGSLYIPKKLKFRSDSITCLDNKLPVFSDTFEGDNNYDLFYNAFIYLSRLEEWQESEKGIQINSYSSKHPRKDDRTWGVPVVNYLFNELESRLRTLSPVIDFSPKEKPVVELSHDVDYVEKTAQLRLKQSAFNIFNAGKQFVRGNSKDTMAKLKDTVAFLRSSDYYQCFDYWEELEKRFDKRSVLYIFAKTPGEGPKEWLIDPSYNISIDNKLKQRLGDLSKEGFEIGLHGSYNSATDALKAAREKEILENALGLQATKTRQHWLRYDEKITPYIHDSLFKFDSTLGWNNKMGFRSGCASRYQPYDHKEQKPFGYHETPMIIMDSHIYDYGCDDDNRLPNTMRLLEALKECKRAHVSICWHERACSKDYGWHESYEKILNAL